MSEHDQQKTVVLTVPFMPPSLNKYYAGMHWSARRKITMEWAKAVWATNIEIAKHPFKNYPLSVTCQLQFKAKHNRDTDNTIMGVKLTLDTLKHIKQIPDDDTRYIGKITLLPPTSGWQKDETIIKLTEPEN